MSILYSINYIVSVNVPAKNKPANKYEYPVKVPELITEVWTNETVTILRGSVKECITIRWVKPYYELYSKNILYM